MEGPDPLEGLRRIKIPHDPFPGIFDAEAVVERSKAGTDAASNSNISDLHVLVRRWVHCTRAYANSDPVGPPVVESDRQSAGVGRVSNPPGVYSAFAVSKEAV
jgi:hypothetical protein